MVEEGCVDEVVDVEEDVGEDGGCEWRRFTFFLYSEDVVVVEEEEEVEDDDGEEEEEVVTMCVEQF